MFKAFQSELAYTRAEKLMSHLESLFEKNPGDDYVAYKLLSTKLGVDKEYLSLKSDSIEEWQREIWAEIEKRDYSEDVLTDLKFSKVTQFMNYQGDQKLEICKTEQEEVMSIVEELRSYYYLERACNNINYQDVTDEF